jgi:glucose/arabinose dehydrogenase
MNDFRRPSLAEPTARWALFASLAFVLACSAPVAGRGEVDLAWDPSPDPAVAGYEIRYGTESGIYTETVDAGDRTEYKLSNLPPGQTLYVCVIAYDAERHQKSECSNEIVATAGPSTTSRLPRDAPSEDRIEVETVAVLPRFAKAMVLTDEARILVAEKGGFGGLVSASIRVVENGILLPRPLITFREVQTRGEMGILGLALHPDYAENRLVYALYTNGSTGVNRVVRFADERLDQTEGDATVVVDDLPAGACGDHQGGALGFGPDRRLYVGLGDDGCDACASQDFGTLAGKILRYTEDGRVPEDNPFGPESPIFAVGLRNAFDVTFDPGTGRLFATENGTVGDCDEINAVAAGGNYGWPFFQCTEATAVVCSSPRAAQSGPLLEIPSLSPTGLAFYAGALLYGDWKTGTVRRMALDADGQRVGTSEVVAAGLGPITDLVVSALGRLYVLTEQALVRVRLD